MKYRIEIETLHNGTKIYHAYKHSFLWFWNYLYANGTETFFNTELSRSFTQMKTLQEAEKAIELHWAEELRKPGYKLKSREFKTIIKP